MKSQPSSKYDEVPPRASSKEHKIKNRGHTRPRNDTHRGPSSAEGTVHPDAVGARVEIIEFLEAQNPDVSTTLQATWATGEESADEAYAQLLRSLAQTAEQHTQETNGTGEEEAVDYCYEPFSHWGPDFCDSDSEHFDEHSTHFELPSYSDFLVTSNQESNGPDIIYRRDHDGYQLDDIEEPELLESEWWWTNEGLVDSNAIPPRSTESSDGTEDPQHVHKNIELLIIDEFRMARRRGEDFTGLSTSQRHERPQRGVPAGLIHEARTQPSLFMKMNQA